MTSTMFISIVVSATLVGATVPYQVLVIGDWGGASDAAPVDGQEVDCGKGMAAVANKSGGAAFVVAVGDNFYRKGISAGTAATRFKTTFESAFTDPAMNIPFYAIAGNHDHLGDVGPQIAYTGKGSGRWNFPDYHYVIHKTLPDNKTLDIVMFDSVLLIGQSEMLENGTCIVPEGPDDEQLASDEWAFIETSVTGSKADYLFTAAHYPVYSSCMHGSLLAASPLLQLLQQYQVNGHISGHDHCLEHYSDTTGTVQYIVSGAGSDAWYAENMPVTAATKKFVMSSANQKGDAGFVALTFTDAGAVATYHVSDGSVVYTSDAMPPRRHEALVV